MPACEGERGAGPCSRSAPKSALLAPGRRSLLLELELETSMAAAPLAAAPLAAAPGLAVHGPAPSCPRCTRRDGTKRTEPSMSSTSQVSDDVW